MGLLRSAITHPQVRNNGFFFASTAVTGLASYLLSTTAARTFAPGDYSQFGILLNLLAYCLPFSTAITGATLRQASLNRVRGDDARTAAMQRALFARLSLAVLLGLGMVALVREPIGQFLRLTVSAPLFLVVVIGYGLTVQASFAAVWQEQGKYGRISLLFLIEGVFRGVFGVAAILLGASMVAVLAIYTVSSVALIFLFPRPPALVAGERAARRAMRPLYRDIGRLAVGSLIQIALTNVDVLLCRRFLDPVTADHYVAIISLAKFFLFATGSVSVIAFAETVKEGHRNTGRDQSFRFSLALVAAAGAAFIAFCALFGPFVTQFAFGPSFRASGDALWIAATSAVAMSLVNLVIAYFNAHNWLWYLPVLVAGGGVIVVAFALAVSGLVAYVGIYAAGLSLIALVLLAIVALRWGAMQLTDGVEPSIAPAEVPGRGQT